MSNQQVVRAVSRQPALHGSKDNIIQPLSLAQLHCPCSIYVDEAIMADISGYLGCRVREGHPGSLRRLRGRFRRERCRSKDTKRSERREFYTPESLYLDIWCGVSQGRPKAGESEVREALLMGEHRLLRLPL
jgi:hypothetical protein